MQSRDESEDDADHGEEAESINNVQDSLEYGERSRTSQETRSEIDVRHFVSEYRAETLLSDPGTSLTTARLQHCDRDDHMVSTNRLSCPDRVEIFWKQLGQSGRSYGNQA